MVVGGGATAPFPVVVAVQVFAVAVGVVVLLAVPPHTGFIGAGGGGMNNGGECRGSGLEEPRNS